MLSYHTHKPHTLPFHVHLQFPFKNVSFLFISIAWNICKTFEHWWYDRSTPPNIWRQKKLGARPSKFIVCESIHPCCGSPLDSYVYTMYIIQKYSSAPRCGFPYNTCEIYIVQKYSCACWFLVLLTVHIDDAFSPPLVSQVIDFWMTAEANFIYIRAMYFNHTCKMVGRFSSSFLSQIWKEAQNSDSVSDSQDFLQNL